MNELFALTDIPAEHWTQIWTPNPVESVFRAVRNHTRKTRGCLSRKTARVMVDQLMMSAKSKGRRLSGSEHLANVIKGVEFQDGIGQFQEATFLPLSPRFEHNPRMFAHHFLRYSFSRSGRS